MEILLLMVWIGSISAEIKNVLTCDGNRNNSVPNTFPTSTIVLDLYNQSIALDECDQEALRQYPLLKELNLEGNNITVIPSKAFFGLAKLEVLNLKNNLIQDINEKAFDGLENLKVLDLSYNQISHLDITQALNKFKNTINVTLSGNPWNCDCSLMNLSLWLNEGTITLDNENFTLCATPLDLGNLKIKDVQAVLLNCTGSIRNSVTPATLPTSVNETSTSTPNKGNSWTFLVGVVVVGIVTSLLILFAVKFPKWYDYLLSYNHHRLKEEEPYTFEEEFNVDLDISTTVRNTDGDNTIVLFEQTHSFAADDDGFIEDKYIEERDIREENLDTLTL
ncbi:leucine-rich repeat-containing protein 19 [Pelodytes ibericus]